MLFIKVKIDFEKNILLVETKIALCLERPQVGAKTKLCEHPSIDITKQNKLIQFGAISKCHHSLEC